MFLGWREIRKSPGRYIGIVALITLITYLVFFLTGLAYGLAQSSRSALDKMPARGMIISAYANDSVAASRISLDALKDIPAANNENVQPIILSAAVATGENANGQKIGTDQFQIALLGFKPDSYLAPQIISGHAVAKNGETVVSETLAENQQLKIGDYIQVEQSDLKVKIVGITGDSKYSVAPAIYLTLADAAKGRPGAKTAAAAQAAAQKAQAQALAALQQACDQRLAAATGQPGGADRPDAQLPAGQAPQAAASAQEPVTQTQPQLSAAEKEKAEIGTVNAFVIGDNAPASLVKIDSKTGSGDVEYQPMSAIIWALPGYAAEVYTFMLMIGFLVAIAAVVIGIFMYILTTQKKPIFGVLKAQGIPNRYIASAVLFQTALVALVGIVLGLLFTLLTGAVLPASAPYQTNWLFIAVGAVVIFLVAGIGAQISVRQVTKIDPLEAMN